MANSCCYIGSNEVLLIKCYLVGIKLNGMLEAVPIVVSCKSCTQNRPARVLTSALALLAGGLLVYCGKMVLVAYSVAPDSSPKPIYGENTVTEFDNPRVLGQPTNFQVFHSIAPKCELHNSYLSDTFIEIR